MIDPKLLLLLARLITIPPLAGGTDTTLMIGEDIITAPGILGTATLPCVRGYSTPGSLIRVTLTDMDGSPIDSRVGVCTGQNVTVFFGVETPAHFIIHAQTMHGRFAWCGALPHTQTLPGCYVNGGIICGMNGTLAMVVEFGVTAPSEGGG